MTPGDGRERRDEAGEVAGRDPVVEASGDVSDTVASGDVSDTVSLVPSAGLGVLHLFYRLPRDHDAEGVLAASKSIESSGGQVVSAAILGHKADLCLMALSPDLWHLRDFQSDIRGAGLVPCQSYFSITEVSEYASGMPEERRRDRLYPKLPPAGKTAFCFYPMSHRRLPGANWYELPYEERERLMYAHGGVGRNFAGRVLQLVSGSTGLDDFEWAVTLFGVAPDDLKDVVYQMRYDEASARYGEFGPFYAGMVAPLPALLLRLSSR